MTADINNERDREIMIEGRNAFRENVKAIMRGAADDLDDWQAFDLIREITEWHDAGRPQVAKMTAAERRAFFNSLEN